MPGLKQLQGFKAHVVIDERQLCIVQVVSVVLGWILHVARVQQRPHPVFKFERVVPFATM